MHSPTFQRPIPKDASKRLRLPWARCALSRLWKWNLGSEILLTRGPQSDRPAWMLQSRTYPLLNSSGRAIVDWVQARRHTPQPGPIAK